MGNNFFTIEELEKELNSGTQESLQLLELLQFVIAQRSLRFKKSDITDRFKLLLQSGQIVTDGFIIQGKDIGINSSNVWLYAVYKHFSTSFGYSIKDEFLKLDSFIEEIGNWFTKEGVQPGIVQLQKALSEFLCFMGWLLDKDALYSFATNLIIPTMSNSASFCLNGILNLLPELSIGFDKSWALYKQYAINLGNPEQNTFDMRWQDLFESVQAFATKQLTETEKLKEIVFKEMQTPVVERLVFAICLGLYDNKSFDSAEFTSWLDTRSRRKMGLTLFQRVEIEDAGRKLIILRKLAHLTEQTLEDEFQLPAVFVQLWKNETETEIVSICKDAFTAAIKSKRSDIVKNTISIARLHDGEDDFFTDLFISLLTAETFNKEYAVFFNNFYSTHLDTVAFFRFLRAYAIYVGFQFPTESFELSLGFHLERSREIYEIQVVSMCTSNAGMVRWAGKRILLYLFGLEERAIVGIKLFQLPAVEQYKLAWTLSIPIHPVNHIVPLLAQLLLTPYSVVKEFVLYKLEEMIRGYKIQVIEELDFALPESFELKKDILTRLRVSLRKLVNELELKQNIAEFDPQKSEPQLYRLYLETYSKKSADNMREARKQRKSVMDFANKISIARGGGWKVKNDNKVQPLSRFSVSFTLPRTVFIRPECMDHEMKQFFLTDWENIFEPWQQIISS